MYQTKIGCSSLPVMKKNLKIEMNNNSMQLKSKLENLPIEIVFEIF